jgi:hypothetical protein
VELDDVPICAFPKLWDVAKADEADPAIKNIDKNKTTSTKMDALDLNDFSNQFTDRV